MATTIRTPPLKLSLDELADLEQAARLRGPALARELAPGYRREEATGPVRQVVVDLHRAGGLDGAFLDTARKFGLDTRRDFRAADLAHLNLRGENFTGADLRAADLSGSDLTNALLIATQLDNADLTGAILISADLTGAVLSGARLEGADLTGARLLNATMPQLPPLSETRMAETVLWRTAANVLPTIRDLPDAEVAQTERSLVGERRRLHRIGDADGFAANALALGLLRWRSGKLDQARRLLIEAGDRGRNALECLDAVTTSAIVDRPEPG